LAPAGRERLVQRALNGEKPKAVAAALGISERTVYKWLKRYREEGAAGLLDRSSRPHRSPNRISRVKRRRIEQLRRERWSSPRIARELRMPLSTVVLQMRRLGLSRLSRLDPPTPVIRYERSRPGELLHVDTKKLGGIRRVGHRIHGDRSTRGRGVGWEYLYVCVDDASRVSYCEILPDEKGPTAAGFITRAASWFGNQGVHVERVMTDNGCNFVAHAFREAVAQLGARHLRTRPYTPRTNGKAERFIQTSLREWAYARPYSHSQERLAALPTWLRFYNRERPHLGIGGRSPQLRLQELVNNVPVNDS
jgi:transposase InsO family protein